MRVRVLVVACALVASAIPVARAQTKVPSIERVPAGIVSLLDDYGNAFRTHNEDLLAQTLAARMRDRELRALDNSREIPFRVYRIRPLTLFSGNLASPRVRKLYPGREVAVYHVVESSALDIEPGVYEEDGAYTFVRDPSRRDPRYEGWRIASKSDLDVLAFFSPYHVWDAGPIEVLRSDHFVLLAHPPDIPAMRSVIAIAERALKRVIDFWPDQTPRNYVIVVPRTGAELNEIIHEAADIDKFVAFTSAGAGRERGWMPSYPRLYMHVAHLRAYPEQYQLAILAHELAHAITRPVSGPHIPVWVEEGLADVAGQSGGRFTPAQLRPAPGEFPSDEQFLSGPVRSIEIAYDRADLAIQALVGKFGRSGLARFYRELGRARVAPGTDEYQLRVAVKKALGWSEPQWLDAWHKLLSR